ncbi:MAG: hypothetical protein WCK42_00845 [Myxococcaceae bacterium]
MKNSISSIPKLQSEESGSEYSQGLSFTSSERSNDSFQAAPLEKKSSKLTTVLVAHKNTAGDGTASVISSVAPVIKHGATFLRHASGAVTTAASIAPLGSALGSGISLIKDGHTQRIVEQRQARLKALYEQVFEAHWAEGISDLEPGTPISELHTPCNHDRSACETMYHTLEFVLGKTEDRINNLKTQQKGSSIIMVGAATTATGSVFFGIGAIPGIIIATAGSVVNLAPTIRGIFRAASKKYDGIKGVDRKSSAKFIWALALRKAVHEGSVSRNQLQECDEARGAFCLAEEWHYLRKDRENDIENAQNIAHNFLERMGILEEFELSTKACFKRIQARLSSKASV